jgi:GNAT superfamily N-acetyltransferase
MKNPTITAVPYHDSKRVLELYECVAEDHLAVQEWLDRHLRGDYLFKKQHLRNVITRPTSVLFAILLDGLYVGTAIVYNGSVLHNIMIAEEWRGLGIGEAVIRFLAPSVIRAKTNMVDGDPVPFYQKMGYEAVRLDADRPHIVVMEPAVAASARSLPAGSERPQQGEPAPDSTVARVAVPPEASKLEADALKWRALKARQKARQDRKKAERKRADEEYATRYLPPLMVNGETPEIPIDYNSHRD